MEVAVAFNAIPTNSVAELVRETCMLSVRIGEKDRGAGDGGVEPLAAEVPGRKRV